MNEHERIAELEFKVGEYQEQVRELKALVANLQNRLAHLQVDMNVLETLQASMEAGLQEDGGVWPVYTGDGE